MILGLTTSLSVELITCGLGWGDAGKKTFPMNMGSEQCVRTRCGGGGALQFKLSRGFQEIRDFSQDGQY